MYSGTTFRNKSGHVIGAHQKIDRVARRLLGSVLPAGAKFPLAKQILHFEGKNGPDGIKRKSPGRDEPWHFIDPDKPEESQLLTIIDYHLDNLANALAIDNDERSAFEAAWLAHAIVDGLTPAHHYPFEKKLEDLRGEGIETRASVKQKLVMPGKTKREKIKNNWQFWGAKGLMTTHLLFEFGVSTTIAGLKLNQAKPSADQLIRAQDSGIRPVFLSSLAHIHQMKMYERFIKSGWTRKLARQTRQELAPVITEVVILAWCLAAHKAAQKRSRS